MKKTILFLACIGLIWACSNSEQSSSNNENVAEKAPPPAPKGPDGEKIYKQYCVVCHGVSGDLGASGAFDLTTSKLTLEERIPVITNGRNLMTAFNAILDEEKIKAVATYTLSLKKE